MNNKHSLLLITLLGICMPTLHGMEEGMASSSSIKRKAEAEDSNPSPLTKAHSEKTNSHKSILSLQEHTQHFLVNNVLHKYTYDFIDDKINQLIIPEFKDMHEACEYLKNTLDHACTYTFIVEGITRTFFLSLAEIGYVDGITLPLGQFPILNTKVTALVQKLYEKNSSFKKICDFIVTSVKNIEPQDLDAAYQSLQTIPASIASHIQALVCKDFNCKTLLQDKPFTYDPQKYQVSFSCMTITHDKREAILGTWGQGIVIIDLATGEIKQRYTSDEKHIYSVAVTSDNRYILAASSSKIRIWDRSTKSVLCYFIRTH